MIAVVCAVAMFVCVACILGMGRRGRPTGRRRGASRKEGS